MIPNDTLLVFNIERDDVEKKNYKPVKSFIKELDRFGIQAFQSAAITFDGYDDDPRELSDIEEVRAYIRKLFNDHPYLFYYMSFSMEVPQYLVPALGNFYSIYKGKKMTKDEIIHYHLTGKELPTIKYIIHIPEPRLKRMVAETRKLAKKHGIEDEIKPIIRWILNFQEPIE